LHYPDGMSQRAVEQVLGKLLTDEGFREAFFADPEGTASRSGLTLSATELDGLRAVSPRALATLCACLDSRLCRLYVPETRAEKERRS
jgi:hypothetical protein